MRLRIKSLLLTILNLLLNISNMANKYVFNIKIKDALKVYTHDNFWKFRDWVFVSQAEHKEDGYRNFYEYCKEYDEFFQDYEFYAFLQIVESLIENGFIIENHLKIPNPENLENGLPVLTLHWKNSPLYTLRGNPVNNKSILWPY